MKKYNLLSLFFFLFLLSAQSQTCITDEDPEEDPSACCNDLIRTDFNNPSNTEYPALLNQFNWLAPTQPQTEPPLQPQTLDVNINNSLVAAEHPFLVDNTQYFWFSSYRNGQGFPQEMHNMHPRYGWELMHLNLGLGLFGDDPANNTGQFNPYMLFYNKHTGKLRIFTSPGNGNSFDHANVDLVIADGGAGSGLVSSALLNRYHTRQKALDQDEQIQTISSHLPFSTPNKWSVADFQLSYDPCNCSRTSRINFNFTERSFSEADLYGRIVGRNVPLSTTGTSPLAFGNDFLSSVWVDANGDGENDNGRNSMLVYNQIAQDVESAYVSDAMKFYSSILDLAAGSLKGVKTKFPVGNDSLPVGPIAAAGAGFASKQINPSAPNITYLEAEAAIVGTITHDSNSGSFANIELLSPGSFAPVRADVPWTQHTFYNELPGLFALLKTPKMQYAHDWGGENSEALGGFGVAIEEPLEYALNPAAEIDMEATEIYAAIEFDVYSPWDATLHEAIPDIYGASYDGDEDDVIIANLIGLPENSPYTNITDTASYDAAQSMAKILSPSFDLSWIEFPQDLPPEEPLELLDKFPVLKLYNYQLWKKYGLDSLDIVNGTNPGNSGIDTKLTFQTALVPIDRLDDLRFTEKFKKLAMNHSHQADQYPALLDLFDFRLKIIANYKFLPNAYGEVNETVQVYTYEFGEKNQIDFADLDACTDTNNPICNTTDYNAIDIQESITLNTQNFSSSQDIYANTIYIIGELTTDDGVVVNLFAADEIVMLDITDQFPDFDSPGVSPSINLIIQEPYPHEGLSPISEVDLKSFCGSSEYQADIRQEEALEEGLEEKQLAKQSAPNYNLFPNPARDQLNFYLDLEQDAHVSTRFMNISGMELNVYSIDEDWSQGRHFRPIQIEDLTSGLYLFEVCVDGNCSVEKISVIN